MSREVLQMALEALKDPHPGVRTALSDALEYRERVKIAITAIKAALVTKDVSLPEQEPVATTAADHIKNEMGYCQFHANVPNDTKLYTSPPQRQEEQEPVAMHEDWYDSNSCGHCGMVGGHINTCRHYTSPPQPTIKQSLTVEQEPVAWWDAKLGVFDEKHFDQLQPLFTAPPRRQPLKRVTIEDARDYLNINDKAMWVIGWNECVEAHNIKGTT